MPTKPLLPVTGLTPEAAASPAVSSDPFANFPDAKAALSTTTLMPPFSQTPAGRGEAPAPAPEVTPPAAAPAADPFASFPDAPAAADPFAGFQDASTTRGYDLAKLKATDVTSLVKDKTDFNPVEFVAKNEKELLADPAALQKVQDAYAEREKEKMSAGQAAEMLVTAPLKALIHPIEAIKTGAKAVKSAYEIGKELYGGVTQVAKSLGQAAGSASTGDFKETAARLMEATSAFDLAQSRWVTTITDKILPGVGVLPRPTDMRERMFFDADFKKREIAAAAGNGELSQALGTDAESLKQAGVTLDPTAIEKLATIEDPIFLVPIGGAIGVVSKSGKFLLGHAVGDVAAESFAKLGNAMLERTVGGSIEGITKLIGQATEKLGAGAEAVGAKTGELLHEITPSAAFVGASVLHHPLVALVKAAPKLLEFTGKGIEAAGRGIQAAAPFAGRVGLEAGAGAAEAGALSLPLFIGSTPEERDSLIGMIALGGALRGGGAAVGIGAEAGGRAAQDKLARTIFESVDRGPIEPSRYYGTDASLDVAHAEHAQSLSPGETSVLNWTREFLRASGIEIYALDNKAFTNHVPHVGGAAAAEGYYVKRGERINPDGSRHPVVQIMLNGDTNGLGHELYHAFKTFNPEGAQALESHIEKTWHPAERQWIADQYNAALNGGMPQSQWEVRLDKGQILEEAAAEVFGRTFNATDLSGVVPSVRKKAALFASSVLEKMNYPLAGKGLGANSGPGVSALGVRPSTAELKVSREFLSNLTQQVKDGRLSSRIPAKEPIIAGGVTGGDISRTPAKASKVAKPPTVPLPVPAPPVVRAARPAPAVETAPNIRVTPKEQLDYAAQRSKVTNAAPALEDAKKLPEPTAAEHVQTVNDAMAAGHGVEITHKGVIREGGATPESPVARGERRSEQEAAYVAEAMGAVPADVREQHQKVLFPTRWQKTAKSGQQLTARSLDKALANIKNSVEMMTTAGEPMPYEVAPDGKTLSEAGWHEAVQDLKDYWGNQDRGYRGDGEPFVRPVTDIGVSLPPVDPRGPVAKISTERMDFLNLVQGLNIPEAVTRQTAGKIPGNVKGQLLAELQGKVPTKPTVIKPEDIARQEYKPIAGVPGTREIAEVNPLRERLRKYGEPVGKLIEVTENVNLKNIESVTPRLDIVGHGGVTDIARAGFSVKAGETKPATIAGLEDILKLGPAEWIAAAKGWDGGQTKESYRLGLGLTDVADLGKLADFQDRAQAQVKGLMAAGDFDSAMQLMTKAQFFREAWEAAQGIGSANGKEGFRKYFPGAEPPFPQPGPAAGKFSAKAPEPSKEVRAIAETAAKAAGVKNYKPSTTYAAPDPAVLKKLADFYESAKSAPADPAVKASYDALISQTEKQGQAILDAGYTIEPFTGVGEPYKSSAEMVADVRDNKHLSFLSTDKAFASATDNPMLRPSTIVKGQVANDVFRWVHDFFGHAKEGYQFGPRGEFNAWKSHSEMFTPEAQGALAAETLAQNSWVNFGKHLRDETGNVIAKGDTGYVDAVNRPFAEQKNVVVPDALLEEARGSFSAKGKEKVTAAAWKDEKGKVHTGPFHASIYEDLGMSPLAGQDNAHIQAGEGFVTNKGRFVDRAEAAKIGEAAKQIPKGLGEVSAETFNNFESGAPKGEFMTAAELGITQAEYNKRYGSFSVKKKPETEAQARKRIEETDYSKYNVPEAAKEMKTSGTGWVLPNKEFVPLDQAYHEQFLAENSVDLNKRFGTDFKPEWDQEQRLVALNKGFIRSRYQIANGRFHIEASADHWTPKAKNAVYDLLEKHETALDTVNVSLLDKKGNTVDRVVERVHDLEGADKMSAVKDALDGLRPGAARSAGSSFSVAASEALPGFEEKGGSNLEQRAVRNRVAASRDFPEALPLDFRKGDNGKYELSNGKPMPIVREYNLNDSPLAKEAAHGLKGAAREEAYTDALASKVEKLYKTAEKNPEIKAGEKWYSTCRTRLRSLLGDDTKIFAELLGATSARTEVSLNFKFAVEAYNQWKSGAYDSILEKYREGKQNFETGDVAEYVDATKDETPTRASYLQWWIDKHDLTPLQSNGKKFGINSRQVLKVLDGSWAAEVGGPKTPNFTGNLTGTTFEATIDIWAARMLHRLSNEGNDKKWRIQPGNETGVTDTDFYTGQKAFRKAAAKLGMKPDALQAVLWFAEKDHWQKEGWTATSSIGEKKSDFNSLLSSTERGSSGKLTPKEAQRGLDFSLNPGDVVSKKKP